MTKLKLFYYDTVHDEYGEYEHSIIEPSVPVSEGSLYDYVKIQFEKVFTEREVYGFMILSR